MTVVEQVSPDSVSFVLPNLVHDEEEAGDFDASLGRTRTGSVQDDALPKTMACLSSNVAQLASCLPPKDINTEGDYKLCYL